MLGKHSGTKARFGFDDEHNAPFGPLQVVWIPSPGADGHRSGTVAIYLSNVWEDLYPGYPIKRQWRSERSNPTRRLTDDTG
jgi:hypothetical protein